MKKQQSFKTKGMNRDISVSAFSPEFSFENMNLRLSTNDDNTTLSLVNEKGQKPVTITGITPSDTTPSGCPIGTAIIDHKLILFTTDADSSKSDVPPDHIYKITFETDTDGSVQAKCTNFFNGKLNFSTKHPLETLVSFESTEIEKVYWTDGYNQPRVINVAKDKVYGIKPGYSDVNYISFPEIYSYFDFTPGVLPVSFQYISVEKNPIGGTFPQGVIQYCYSYYKKNGQQSNIISVSPIQYLSFQDRGASTTENVSCSFNIHIDAADLNYDYVRIYSILRTSYNASPLVSIVDDIPIEPIVDPNSHDGGIVPKRIVYTDTGLHHTTIDPNELHSIGGLEVIVQTMMDKDNKLFLGNIKQNNSSIVSNLQKYFNENKTEIKFKYFSDSSLNLDHNNGVYTNTCQIAKYSQQDIAHFKGGEWYRFGFQLQTSTGEWLEPIYLNDAQNLLYPQTFNDSNDAVNFSTPYVDFNIRKLIEASGMTKSDFAKKIVKIRPVVVYPSLGERTVLCQGVLNPTVFNAADRATNSPFAQSSWYFRPYVYKIDNNDDSNKTTNNDVNALDVSKYVSVSYESVGTITSENYKNYISDGDKTVYIIRYNNTTDAKKALQNGYIAATFTAEYEETYHDDMGVPYTELVDNEVEYKIPFAGAIYIPGFVDSKRLNFYIEHYIFIRYEPWPKEVDTSKIDLGSNGYLKDKKLHYPNDIKEVPGTPVAGIENSPFKISSNLKVAESSDNKGLFYYEQKSASSSDTYEFKYFDIKNTITTVKFTSTGIGTYETESKYLGGSILTYGHYQHLYSQQDFKESNKMDSKDAQKIEIQGSVTALKAPYNTDNSNFESDVYSQANASTEFFVDQSIVTLNSPDIDFDTTLQNYTSNGLGLRITGYIPITSNASAHHITSGKMAMLGLNNGATTARYGIGELSDNIVYGYPVNSYAGRRLVAGFLWNDTSVWKSQDEVGSDNTTYDWLVFPWQAKRSLNFDDRPSDDVYSMLKTKKESTLLYSLNSVYFFNNDKEKHTSPIPDDKYELPIDFEDTSIAITSTDNTAVYNERLSRQSLQDTDINYYPNIDKVLVNNKGYNLIRQSNNKVTYGASSDTLIDTIPMKYNSTSHAVIALKEDSKGNIPILPYARFKDQVPHGTVPKCLQEQGQ